MATFDGINLVITSDSEGTTQEIYEDWKMWHEKKEAEERFKEQDRISEQQNSLFSMKNTTDWM